MDDGVLFVKLVFMAGSLFWLYIFLVIEPEE